MVEAALCGTPAITTAFGAFTETVAQDRTGFRCQTTAQFLEAIDRVRDLDRKDIRARARRLYGMRSVSWWRMAARTRSCEDMVICVPSLNLSLGLRLYYYRPAGANGRFPRVPGCTIRAPSL